VPEDPNAPRAPPPVSKRLAIAERWAKTAGKQVDRGEGQGTDGSKYTVLRVMHGQSPVLVREQGDTVVVFAMTQIPEELRAALRKLSPQDLLRVDMGVREQLLSNPRVGYAMHPQTLKSLTELEVIDVERQVAIDDRDLSSKNTYLDAIQEVVVVMFRVLLALRLVNPGQAVPDGTSSAKTGGPPSPMYG
jgi:hypothetical protein